MNYRKIIDPIGSTRLPAVPCRSNGVSMPCPPSTHPVAIVVAQLAQPFGEVRGSFWIRFLFQGNAAHDFAE
jgi:hypothetical protein